MCLATLAREGVSEVFCPRRAWLGLRGTWGREGITRTEVARAGGDFRRRVGGHHSLRDKDNYHLDSASYVLGVHTGERCSLAGILLNFHNSPVRQV